MIINEVLYISSAFLLSLKKDPEFAPDLLRKTRTGLEPVTPCVTGMYSNQLN